MGLPFGAVLSDNCCTGIAPHSQRGQTGLGVVEQIFVHPDIRRARPYREDRLRNLICGAHHVILARMGKYHSLDYLSIGDANALSRSISLIAVPCTIRLHERQPPFPSQPR